MQINKLPRPSVGADLSRPPPIYRPPVPHRIPRLKTYTIIGLYARCRIILLNRIINGRCTMQNEEASTHKADPLLTQRAIEYLEDQ